jgi:uncharacterized protein YeaO (DUF488 family)
MGGKPDVRVRRIYDAPEPDDGIRVLVDRIWPRGLTKDKARLDHWFKQVAPSTELRKWYSHDPERFEGAGQERDADAAHRDQACRDQRGRGACRPDQGLSRAVLASTIGCTPACSTSTVSSDGEGARRRLEGDVRPLPAGTGGPDRRAPQARRARARTQCRRCHAASAERRRWPWWRRRGLVSRVQRRGWRGRLG